MEFWPFNNDRSRLGGGGGGLLLLIESLGLGNAGEVLGANWVRREGGINDSGSDLGSSSPAAFRWIRCMAIANSSIVRRSSRLRSTKPLKQRIHKTVKHDKMTKNVPYMRQISWRQLVGRHEIRSCILVNVSLPLQIEFIKVLVEFLLLLRRYVPMIFSISWFW